MQVDHFFTIGRPHVAQGAPCEDYALSAELDGRLAVAAVCDGCSGAEADTDVGARALAFAYQQTMLSRVDQAADAWHGAGFLDQLMGQFIRNQFTGWSDDYLATLVGVMATREDARVFVVGDGAVAVRFAGGRYRLIELEWHGNAPFYLQYRTKPGFAEAYVATLTREGAAEGAFSVNYTDFAVEGGRAVLLDESYEKVPASAAVKGREFKFSPAAEGIEAIAVFSDGISRVQGVETIQVVADLMAFKNFRGEFVRRRAIAAMKGYDKAGQVLNDDLAVACVWLGEVPA